MSSLNQAGYRACRPPNANADLLRAPHRLRAPSSICFDDAEANNVYAFPLLSCRDEPGARPRLQHDLIQGVDHLMRAAAVEHDRNRVTFPTHTIEDRAAKSWVQRGEYLARSGH